MPPTGRLAALFPHEIGPAGRTRTVAVGELREWPALWSADPRVPAAIGGDEAEAAVRAGTARLRYFAAADPAFPAVPLLPATPDGAAPACDPADPRPPTGTGVRDKVWQRLVVEGTGLFPQPGFAAVDGDRVRAINAPWVAQVAAVDCRPATAALRAAAAPGTVIVVESSSVGFVAWVGGDGVRVVSRSPHAAALPGGSGDCRLPPAAWPGFVADLAARPLPLGVTKAAFNPAAGLADALRACPGAYILKPRFGSNGVGVGRTRDRLLAAADALRAVVVPLAEARGARVHQFGIDTRLCWNPATGRAEFPFLELQFGIGRIDWAEMGVPAPAGYDTPARLRLRFGPETG